MKSFQRLLAVGVLLCLVGETVGWMSSSTGVDAATVSWADAFFLAGHAAFVAAVLLLRDGDARMFRTEDVLESLIVACGVGVTVWIFVVGSRPDVTLAPATFVDFWPPVAYACADAFVVSLLAILLLTKRARIVPLAAVAVAFSVFAVAGLLRIVSVNGLELGETPVPYVGLLLGYALLVSAVLLPSSTRSEGSVDEPPAAADRVRLAGLSAAVVMTPVVMGVQLVRGVPVEEWGWTILTTSVTVVALVGARMVCFLGVLRRQASALTRAATSDSITGLANRRHLGDLLDRSIHESGGVAVFLVDIDRFAQINETFGYPVGDEVLKEIGDRLVATADDATVVSRLGGDQFVVSIPSSHLPGTPEQYATRLQNAVGRAMFVRDIDVALEATVGVVESSKFRDVDAEILLQHAHVALTAAKSGHTSTAAYVPAMDHDRHEQMRMLGELHTALRNRELRVFFQPCLDLASGRVSGVEALLRWQHPRQGLITPWYFLPDAERTGMLPAITAYVLDDALSCASVMRRARKDFTVAINLSVRNLVDRSLVEQVAGALQRHDVPSTAVEFEVTETSAMVDPRRSVDSLVALRDLGVSIAMDDYGTGYSSLAYLRSLPVQRLKIDKSFVTAMNTQPTNASIVRSTIDLARSLGMSVVAEGVEDQSTLDLLKKLGCNAAQGFHIGHPVPADELPALIARIERTTGAADAASAGKRRRRAPVSWPVPQQT